MKKNLNTVEYLISDPRGIGPRSQRKKKSYSQRSKKNPLKNSKQLMLAQKIHKWNNYGGEVHTEQALNMYLRQDNQSRHTIYVARKP